MWGEGRNCLPCLDATEGIYIDHAAPHWRQRGSLHQAICFSYAQAEMIARFHRMGGHVYYPFGFDDNGLPMNGWWNGRKAASQRPAAR